MKTERMRRAPTMWIAIILFAAALLAIPAWTLLKPPAGKPPHSGPFVFEAINVGKGDALLIICGGEVMLVDAGYENTSKEVIDRLKAYGVSRINKLVLTHPDKDHYGGMAAVVRAYSVGDALIGPADTNAAGYTAFHDELNKKGIKPRVPAAGEEFSVGDAAVQVLQAQGDFPDENDTSIVLRIVYGETAFLLAGDIEKKGEAALLSTRADLSADVLKVAHHGREDSTSEAFLNAVKPSLAIVTCNERDTSEKPPSAEVLERLESRGASVYRSDYNGNITIISSGEGISVSLQHENYTE